MKSLLLMLLAAYLVIMALMYLFQRHLLYFPRTAETYEQPHNYELKRDDVVLRGWVLNAQAEHALMYFGGNAERIDFNINWLSRFFPHQAIYLVNYRGYGGSDGVPEETLLSSDALAVFDDVSSKHARVSLFGRSLGTGVATHVAAQRSVHRLALVTPYDSILNVAKQHYPVFPVSWLLKDRWESWKNAQDVSAQTLVIYGGRDRVVPPASTERLIEYFTAERLQVMMIDESDHDNILGDKGALSNLVIFLDGDTTQLKR